MNREVILTVWAIFLFLFVLVVCAMVEGWLDK